LTVFAAGFRLLQSGILRAPQFPFQIGPMNAQTAPSGTSAKSDVDAILSTLAAQLSGTKLRDAQSFAVEFLRRLPAEDLASRDASLWAAIVLGSLEFLRERRPGSA
jgi:glutamate dehydrogenase